MRSARFAGDEATYAENVAKLLADLEGESDRRARFRTVAICRLPGGAEIIAEGVVEGEIVSGSARRAAVSVMTRYSRRPRGTGVRLPR